MKTYSPQITFLNGHQRMPELHNLNPASTFAKPQALRLGNLFKPKEAMHTENKEAMAFAQVEYTLV